MILTTNCTREEWLTRRKAGIGASESAAVLGVSPWSTPFQVWSHKTGLAEPEDLSGNEAVEFGCRLEWPIAEAYAERTGRLVRMWPQFEIASRDDLPWMTCTPDAIQEDESLAEGLLQIKTTAAWNAGEWADGPPLHYQVQCQHEMAVTGHVWSTLVVLIGGNRLRFFDLERNDTFIDAMIARLAEFWHLVEAKTPPPVDGSLATAKALAKLHPEDNGETVMLPMEAQQWTDELEAIKADLKRLEADKTDRENRIKAALGDATYGLLTDGSRWSWKTQTRKAYEVAEATFRTLRKVK